MGIARFNGVQKVQGGSMPFESYLKQIHLLYPNVADMYVKYTTMINEFDSNQIGRLIGESEYEMANSLFDGKLNVFASLKENNLELFEAFLEAFGIREKIGEIFDLAAMTLEEMLELVSLLYEEDYEAYVTAIDMIKTFELEEFMRDMVLTLEDIELDNENYTYFIEKLLTRMDEAFSTFNLLTEDGTLLSLLSEEQIAYVNERLSLNFHAYFMNLLEPYQTPIEELLPSTINLATKYAKNGAKVSGDIGSLLDQIMSKFEYYNENYLDLITDTAFQDLMSILYRCLNFVSKFQEMRLKLGHADARLVENWSNFETGMYGLLDDQMSTIVDQVKNNSEFVLKEEYIDLFKHVVSESIRFHNDLFTEVDNFPEEQQRIMYKSTASAIAQNIYAFMDLSSRHGSMGVGAFSSFFSSIASHMQGNDKWMVVGGVMRNSDPILHADFICSYIFKLVQGSEAETLNKMVGNGELYGFFGYLQSVSPTAFDGIKSMINSM